MNPSSTPSNHPSLTSANKMRLQVSQQYVEELVGWLINKSIPFELNFEQVKQIHQPTPEKADLWAPFATKVPVANPFAEICEKRIFERLDSTPPSAEAIAKELGMSAIGFKNKFKQVYGKPFYQLYLEKKMEYAATLLKQGHNAQRVTEMVGYGKTSAIKFNKMFQKHFGTTPKKYQMEHYGSLNKRAK